MKPPNVPTRRSIRLRGHDYSAPAVYFVTICTHHKECFLSTIRDGALTLSPFGKIVIREWRRTARLRPNVVLLETDIVVMPNHVHFILVILEKVPAAGTSAAIVRRVRPGSLGAIVRAFKAATAREINLLRSTPGAPVWQRNYYEKILRDEQAVAEVRSYILTNPAEWEDDPEHPGNAGR